PGCFLQDNTVSTLRSLVGFDDISIARYSRLNLNLVCYHFVFTTTIPAIRVLKATHHPTAPP
ncbi:hypothetical protein, partial [Yersinia pestis]